MTVETLPQADLITHPHDLAHLARQLRQEPILAVDTESNSLYAYQERVCLIQFSTPDNDFLVDPLAISDLSPLAPVFSDPEIEKVFHAAEYDVICLRRDYGFEFTNIFDTMIAARVLGWQAVGLGSLLAREFNVKVNKRYQRADWGQRPLPRQLLAYAQVDTHYLIPLRHRLYLELEARERLPLAQEDFERTTKANGGANGAKNADCWRVHGAHDLSPREAAVLKELCRYRDQVARARNRPLFKVIGDRTLLAIAQAGPQDLATLKQIPGMSRGQIARHGSAILAAVKRGLQADPAYPPRKPRPSNHYLERLDALRHWRKTTAQQWGVQSDVILPRDLLYRLVDSNPSNEAELGDLLADVPWRRARFGSQILAVLANAAGR